jgi:hypothetical protein
MLSKAQEKSPSPQAKARPEDRLDEDELLDQEIASAALFEGLLSESGLDAIGKALRSPEPAKALGVIIYNVIEPAQVASMDSDTPISPRVWLSTGGAVDELMDELADLGGMFGMEEDEILDMAGPVKREVAAILQKRGQDLQQQGMSASQPQPSPAPMPGGM